MKAFARRSSKTSYLFEPKLFTSVVQPKDIIKNDNLDKLNIVESNSVKTDNNVGEFIGKYTIPSELTEILVRSSDTLIKPLILHHLIISKQMKKALVFTKSVENSHKLTIMMHQFGLSVGELSSKVCYLLVSLFFN